MSSESCVDWPTATIGDITINHNSRRVPVKAQDRRPGPYPYYGASGVIDHVDEFRFDGLHLLVAEDGENLRSRSTPVAFLATDRFWVNNHAHVVTGREGIADTTYLSFVLEQLDLSPYISGSAQPKLTKGALDSIRLTIPPIDEQRRVVGVLGALDQKIRHDQQVGQRLADLLSMMFKHLIAGARDIAPLGDQVEVIMGQSPPGTTYSSESSGMSLVQGMASFGDRFPRSEVFTSAPTKRAQRGDVLMTVRAPVGAINVADGEYCAGRGVAIVRGVHVAYTEQLMRYLERYWREHESGTIYPSVNRAQVVSIPAPKPPTAAIDEYEAQARPVYDLIGALAHAQRRLASVRDGLLPKLVSGAIRVPDSYDPDDALGVIAASAGVSVP